MQTPQPTPWGALELGWPFRVIFKRGEGMGALYPPLIGQWLNADRTQEWGTALDEKATFNRGWFPERDWAVRQHPWTLPAAGRMYPSVLKGGSGLTPETPTRCRGVGMSHLRVECWQNRWAAVARGQSQVTVPIQVNSYCYPGALKFRGGNGWNSPSLCGLRMFLKDAQQSPASFPSRCFSPQLFPHFEAQGDREAGRCYDITRKSGLKDCLRTSKDAPRLGMGLCYSQIPVPSPNCHPWNSFKGNGWTWIQLHKLIYKAELTHVCKALWAIWIDFLNCLPKVLPHP